MPKVAAHAVRSGSTGKTRGRRTRGTCGHGGEWGSSRRGRGAPRGRCEGQEGRASPAGRAPMREAGGAAWAAPGLVLGSHGAAHGGSGERALEAAHGIAAVLGFLFPCWPSTRFSY